MTLPREVRFALSSGHSERGSEQLRVPPRPRFSTSLPTSAVPITNTSGYDLRKGHPNPFICDKLGEALRDPSL
jgi:hypothetical protein